jgi:hypothetical protein
MHHIGNVVLRMGTGRAAETAHLGAGSKLLQSCRIPLAATICVYILRDVSFSNFRLMGWPKTL